MNEETIESIKRYNIMATEELERLKKENKQIKEELERSMKANIVLDNTNTDYASIIFELEEWLNKEKGYYLCGRSNGKTLLYGKELKRIETIDKIQELKEKYK